MFPPFGSFSPQAASCERHDPKATGATTHRPGSESLRAELWRGSHGELRAPDQSAAGVWATWRCSRAPAGKGGTDNKACDAVLSLLLCTGFGVLAPCRLHHYHFGPECFITLAFEALSTFKITLKALVKVFYNSPCCYIVYTTYCCTFPFELSLEDTV